LDEIMLSVLLPSGRDGAGVRIYYHLTNAQAAIRDEEGVEVSDPCRMRLSRRWTL
jgi:hypothetical protein